MELISRLTRIALEMAHEYCLVDWHPDDFPPETYEAELEIGYMPGWEHEGGGFLPPLEWRPALPGQSRHDDLLDGHGFAPVPSGRGVALWEIMLSCMMIASW